MNRVIPLLLLSGSCMAGSVTDTGTIDQYIVTNVGKVGITLKEGFPKAE